MIENMQNSFHLIIEDTGFSKYALKKLNSII